MPDKATIKRNLCIEYLSEEYVITFAFNMQLLVGDITLTLSAFKLSTISRSPIPTSGEGNGTPTPVLLPEKSHGQRTLVGCSSWGR